MYQAENSGGGVGLLFMLIVGYIIYLFITVGKKEKFKITPYQRKQLQEIVAMTDRQFEYHCASWLVSKGYQCEVTGRSGDGNIDIIVRSKDGTLLYGFAECKHWRKPVGAKELKVLYATMNQHGVNNGWFFALNGFSESAIRYYQTLPPDKNMDLIGASMMVE